MGTDTEVGGLLSPSIDTDITEAQDSVKSQIVEPLSIISDLLVHNLTRSKKGVDPVLVKRSITFPGLRYSESGEEMWPHESWAPCSHTRREKPPRDRTRRPDQHRTHWTRPCCTYSTSP
ncbi:hypothetical protein QCA50_019176 [Cerrena zonata]|uniref:Uncharacterized protein n=1 Tax=Cerrena zonata TaxID=2478898 RepID=A0AAW0FEJ5_9APHY